jgi:hypothetical protein
MARSWTVRARVLWSSLGLSVALSAPLAAKPKPPRAAPAGPVITYVGLRVAADGGATIYADLSGKPDVEALKPTGSELRYRLNDARVVFQNNTNPLLAQYFGSAVESARMVPEKGAVVLVIKLRTRGVQPSHRVVAHPGGTSTFLVEVPGPTAKPTSDRP